MIGLPNHLLAALPPMTIERLKLERHPLVENSTLFRPGDAVERIYFPQTGMISLLKVMENGSHIEVGLVGHEGLTPIGAAVGETSTPSLGLVQFSGEALVASFARFSELLLDDGEFRETILRFTGRHLGMLGQLVACNGLHDVTERLARWLLMANDRLTTSDLALGQQFLADMLGVSRQIVNVALGDLERRGAIERARSMIVIRDRARLEDAACECYRELAVA